MRRARLLMTLYRAIFLFIKTFFNKLWEYFVIAPPIILTFTTTATQIPGAEGEQVDLTCIVRGKPPPSLSWKRQLNGNDLNSLNDENVKSITYEKDTSVMKVTVSRVGETFFCVAANLLGSDNQEYIIRNIGEWKLERLLVFRLNNG